MSSSSVRSEPSTVADGATFGRNAQSSVKKRLLAVVVLTASALAATAAASPSRVSVRLDVIRCPTSYAVAGQKGPPIPRAVLVHAQSAIAPHLAAYSNGWLTILAPRGWHCSGGVGADGNEVLDALPRYVSTPSSAAAAVEAARQFNGVAVSTACPFFPELVRGYGFPCSPIPARELVTRLSARTVAFEDPPGVHGTGQPSGGSMPANGIVTYVGDTPRQPQFSVGGETCTLPKSQHSLCAAVLNDYLVRWKR